MPIRIDLLQGPLLAALSAALFGISPVLCKLIIGEMSPILLAGLLYLGSGIGLSFVLAYQHDEEENSEPHDHYHQHERLIHTHVHWPDNHHRHVH